MDIYLALADVQETWDCETDYNPYSDYRGHYNDDDEEEQDLDATELIDSSTVLKHWIDRDNNPLNYRECLVSNKELGWTKANNELKPFQSEHEGFMGNYGNTLDRWYHRAAIILWQKQDHYPILFEMNPERVLNELLEMIRKKSNETIVSRIITSLLPCWSNYIQQHSQSKSHSTVFKLALYLNNPSLAQSMLFDFNMAILTPERAALFLNLQDAYGTPWCLKILKAWTKTKSSWGEDSKCKDIFATIKTFSSHQNHQALTSFLLSYQLEQIITEAILGKKEASRADLLEGLNKRMKEIKDFIKACLIVNNNAAYIKLLNHLLAHLELYPAIELVDSIHLLKENLKTDSLKKWHYQKLFNYVHHKLENEKRQGLRKVDDWSIHEVPSCDCQDCGTLTDFLKSKKINILTWPLGKERRKHLHRIIDDLNVPVSHQTEYTGSPHKLILKKTAKLHQEASLRFDRLKKALNQLTKLRLQSIAFAQNYSHFLE